MQRIWRGAIGVALFFIVLEVYAGFSGLSSQSLPPSSEILPRLATLFVDSEFLIAMGQTLWAAMIGLVLATALAVPLGVVFGSFRATYDAVSALIELIRPIPAPVFVPLVLLIFGATVSMKVSLVTFGTFWIVLFNVIYAVRDVDPVLKDSARIYGSDGMDLLMRVSLRSAAPFIYTGIKIAATMAFLGTVATELIVGGAGGLGQWLYKYEQTGTNTDYVFAGAFFAGLVGLVIMWAFDLGERRFFPWSAAVRSQK